MDGDVFPKGTAQKRCDFLLLNGMKETAYYIEFKGSDIREAVRQIDLAVDQLGASHPGYTVYRRIIYRTGRTHEIKDADVVRWKLKHGKGKDYVVIEHRKYTDNL